jgi:hypothetical protein
MYFPEHDDYGDWRLVGLGFMSHSISRTFAKDHPAQMIFITTQYYNTAQLQCAYAKGFALL